MEVSDPVISQDGKQVAFQSAWKSESYVVGLDGGPAKKIAGRLSYHATLSPDGNSIVYSSWTGDKHDGLRIATLQTGAVSTVPLSEDKVSPFWIDQNTLVAATLDQKSL
jgi:Tol biopolymer transport system component